LSRAIREIEEETAHCPKSKVASIVFKNGQPSITMGANTAKLINLG
jgi:hypothetical protein